MFGNLARWCEDYNTQFYAKQAARREKREQIATAWRQAQTVQVVRPSAPSAPSVVKIDPSAPKNWVLPSSAYNKDYAAMLNSTHILIAGTTGSGKSVVLNGIIHTALTLLSPSAAEFILVDPKIVELSNYKNLPHIREYLTDDGEVADMLDEIYDEMMERYEEMDEKHLRKYDGKDLYIIIDELADLMTGECSRRIRTGLQRLLQKGRAAKIHIIAATQAPSRKVIPAEIVLNFTDRIALRCLSSIESRQIINVSGAEKIKGYGKAMYLSPSAGITWLSIPFVSDETLDEIVSFWEDQDE